MTCRDCYFGGGRFCTHPFMDGNHPYHNEFLEGYDLVSCHTVTPCSLEVACLKTENSLICMGKIKVIKEYTIPKEGK